MDRAGPEVEKGRPHAARCDNATHQLFLKHSSLPLLTRRKSAELAGQAATHQTDRKDFPLRHSIAIAAVAILSFIPLGSVAAQPVMPAYSAPYPGHYPDANWDLSPDWVVAIVRSKGLEPLSHRCQVQR
jgi:hypothetical protein